MNDFAAIKKHIGIVSRTGANCPESGTWRALGAPAQLKPIRKGAKMPPANGRVVQWKLVRYL
ncbi:hypothetical protein [Aegicerativicinus sediminis]|uniref:hypothetical protein n=1 Tax=Aegicerativicinus sediminis TaxID=2893202 RepID=UPI001E5CE19E|nr:hypothetical protein [Aegicerativicinus sediminis]